MSKEIKAIIGQAMSQCKELVDNFKTNRFQGEKLKKICELSNMLYSLLRKRHIWDEWNGCENMDWKWSNFRLQVIRAIKYKMSIEIQVYYNTVENVTSQYVTELENINRASLNSSDIQLITSFSSHAKSVLVSMSELEDRLNQVTNYVMIGRGDQKQYLKEIYKITKYFRATNQVNN